MDFTVTVHHLPDLLLVDGAGNASLADLCGYMNLTGEICNRTGAKRAVLNLMGVTIDLSFTEHLTLGAHAAQQLRSLERVASAVPPQFRTGNSERAAQKMGLRFRTFTSLDEAMEWTLEA